MNSSTALRYSGHPSFQILATAERASADKSPRIPNTDLPWDCNTLFNVMASTKNTHNEPLSVSEARPDYVPEEYYGRALVAEPATKHVAVFICLDGGSSNLVLQISPVPEAADGNKVTPMLRSIADSARLRSTLVYAPGSLHLPLLGVTASISSGAWAVGVFANGPGQKKRDLVYRTSGTIGLEIIPFLAPITCSDYLKKNRPVTKNPRYLSAKWEPIAWEDQKPNGGMDLVVCRQFAPAKALVAAMQYQSDKVSAEDAIAIAKMLDEIGDAVANSQDGSR